MLLGAAEDRPANIAHQFCLMTESKTTYRCTYQNHADRAQVHPFVCCSVFTQYYLSPEHTFRHPLPNNEQIARESIVLPMQSRRIHTTCTLRSTRQ